MFLTIRRSSAVTKRQCDAVCAVTQSRASLHRWVVHVQVPAIYSVVTMYLVSSTSNNGMPFKSRSFIYSVHVSNDSLLWWHVLIKSDTKQCDVNHCRVCVVHTQSYLSYSRHFTEAFTWKFSHWRFGTVVLSTLTIVHKIPSSFDKMFYHQIHNHKCFNNKCFIIMQCRLEWRQSASKSCLKLRSLTDSLTHSLLRLTSWGS